MYPHSHNPSPALALMHRPQGDTGDPHTPSPIRALCRSFHTLSRLAHTIVHTRSFNTSVRVVLCYEPQHSQPSLSTPALTCTFSAILKLPPSMLTPAPVRALHPLNSTPSESSSVLCSEKIAPPDSPAAQAWNVLREIDTCALRRIERHPPLLAANPLRTAMPCSTTLALAMSSSGPLSSQSTSMSNNSPTLTIRMDSFTSMPQYPVYFPGSSRITVPLPASDMLVPHASLGDRIDILVGASVAHENEVHSSSNVPSKRLCESEFAK
eukprot:583309-Rhodomonas_salina.3